MAAITTTTHDSITHGASGIYTAPRRFASTCDGAIQADATNRVLQGRPIGSTTKHLGPMHLVRWAQRPVFLMLLAIVLLAALSNDAEAHVKWFCGSVDVTTPPLDL
jgi:hypothetical protein